MHYDRIGRTGASSFERRPFLKVALGLAVLLGFLLGMIAGLAIGAAVITWP